MFVRIQQCRMEFLLWLFHSASLSITISLENRRPNNLSSHSRLNNMLRNYIKLAIRNLSRYKFFSVINIAGLAISMSICMAIMMLVADQVFYDQHNTKGDR